MLVSSQVGPLSTTSSITPGSQIAVRSGNLGDTITSELHGRYYETTYRRAMFMAANPTGVTTLAFTSGTTTALLGVCVSNPIGSPVNLVLNKVGISFPVITTVVNTALIAVGFNSSTNVTHTTALTVRNSFVGLGQSGFGMADASFTCPTSPNTLMVLASMPSATTMPSTGLFDLEGSIILPPGAYACVITSAAHAASGFAASMGWEEVPV